MKRNRFLIARVVVTAAVAIAAIAGLAAATMPDESADDSTWARALDSETQRHAVDELARGRRIFRFDTFGDELFWGDTLRLHRAIAGRANGGVGPGLSPRQALAAGLKVDVTALPPALRDALRHGRVDLDDPATTLALLRLGAVVGVRGFFEGERLTSVGITCALCHSNVDDSLAPGIGRRLDGWAARDLNVGAIIALAPNLQPFVDLLRIVNPAIDAATVRAVLASWGPGKFDAELLLDGKAFRPDGKSAATLDPAGVRPRRREPAHLDRLGFGHALERLRRQPGDARARARSSIRGSTMPTKFPIAAVAGFADVRDDPDLDHREARARCTSTS